MFSFLFLAYSFSTLLFPCLQAQPQPICNGQSALCTQKYSNISQIGAHDSAFVGNLPQDNQHLSITGQLDAGVRFLQAQTHLDPFGSLNLCHTSCFLADAGSVEGYLTTVKTWMDGHPNEVVTVLLTNGDNVDVAMFDDAFTKSGIKPYAFIPSTTPNPLSIDAWPTLGQLIASNTRLITFLDTSTPSPLYPHLLPEFLYFFETPYDTTVPSFPSCALDRPPNSSPDGKMYILNHFLHVKIPFTDILIPDVGRAGVTNGVESVQQHVSVCEGVYGRGPRVVLVDFWEAGEGVGVGVGG